MARRLAIGFALIGAWTLPAYGADGIEGAVIVYGLNHLDDDAYERILESDDVRYVCFQHILGEGPLPELATERCAELARAGKRNVLQIWWGPSWPYPWSKYSYANIALDAEARDDFWREVVDRCVDGYGAENLYGVHLQEETGMQFGTDVQKRDDPDDFDTFEDDNQSYDHPFYSGWNKKWPGGIDIPNVRRHEADFRRIVGFGFEDAATWEPWQKFLLDRWMSTRLQSGGQVEFAKHIHERYPGDADGPGLKAFTWDLVLWGGENPRTDHRLEAQHFDGVICDVYNDAGHNYNTQRAYRLLYPDAEIIHFSHGGTSANPASIDVRRQRTLASYVAGHDVVGFYTEPMNYQQPEMWAEDVELLRRMSRLPRFESSPRLLVISARVSDIYSLPYSVTGLTHYDILPIWEAHDVDLSPYDALILDTTGAPGDGPMLWDAEGFAETYGFPGLLNYRRINEFARGGGAVIFRGKWLWSADCPLFPVAEGFVHTPEEGPHYSATDFSYAPEGWWRDELGLSGEYKFGLQGARVEVDRPNDVQTSDAGLFFRYGEGACLMIPYHRNYDKEEDYGSEEWVSHRRLMTDLIRAFLMHVGKKRTARECLADPEIGNSYRHAISTNRRIETWFLFHLGIEKTIAPVPLTGTDILSGRKDPVLNAEDSCAVLRR